MPAKVKPIQIEFDKRIYKSAAIRRAVDGYSGFADFSVSEDKEKLIVKIAGVPPAQANELTGEFRNYALYLMKQA
jgi:hypothetical protein